MQNHEVAWIVAGVFALLAGVVSFLQMRLHLHWNPNRELRKFVLRILFMVPVYALESWMGLRFKDGSLYWDVARECYEALVIYSFYMLLVEFLGGQTKVITLLQSKSEMHHMMPFCCLPKWTMGESFFFQTKVGTLQYVVVKPLLAAITFLLTPLGAYEDGDFSANNGYPYIAFVNNASQVWAMYCLILFYMATRDELHDLKPIPKFLCVKAVVFFTFWQSVGLAVLVRVGVIKPTETYSTTNVVTGLQDFLVCIEMFLAAVAHHYAFHYKDFVDPNRPLIGDQARVHNLTCAAAPLIRSLLQVVNVTDVYVGHVREVVRTRASKTKTDLAVPAGSGDYIVLAETSDSVTETTREVAEPSSAREPELVPNTDEGSETETPSSARRFNRRPQ